MKRLVEYLEMSFQGVVAITVKRGSHLVGDFLNGNLFTVEVISLILKIVQNKFSWVLVQWVSPIKLKILELWTQYKKILNPCQIHSIRLYRSSKNRIKRVTVSFTGAKLSCSPARREIAPLRLSISVCLPCFKSCNMDERWAAVGGTIFP